MKEEEAKNFANCLKYANNLGYAFNDPASKYTLSFYREDDGDEMSMEDMFTRFAKTKKYKQVLNYTA